MDITISWQAWETEFRGEKITMELRPLKTKAMLLLMPYLGSTQNPEQAGRASMEMAQLAPQIFPEHVRNLQGLTINGQPPTWEIMAEELMFTALIVEIMAQLASISAVSEEEQKNFTGPSGSLIPPQEQTTTSP